MKRFGNSGSGRCGVMVCPVAVGELDQVGKMPNLGTTAPSKVMLQQNPDGAQSAVAPAVLGI